MEKSACGIISYAGLNREVLLAKAKATFAQAQPPVAGRFDAFLPIFPLELVQNMDYAGPTDARGARVAANGFSIDPAEYHRKLYAQLPELYAEDNYKRNFDYEGRYVGRGVFTVDRAWVDHFPQYQPFMGEKLYIYLIGGGAQAVAVPESVYPRGGGVLGAAETALQITQRAGLYVQYAKARIAAGDTYNAEAFGDDFLTATKQHAVTFLQKELRRLLQDLSIVKNLQNDGGSVGLYTETARLAERVNQYVPMRYACDLFAAEAVDKPTARLAQLYNADADFVSDLWIPYQDLCAYVDKRTQTLDVRALCEGYQIAPRYDPETGGGRYPDAVRVAVVRDRELPLLTAAVLNNPAYGNGMGPQGKIGRQVYITDSREMIRQRKLVVEEITLETANLTLPPAEYRRSLALAVLQEHKGRLVDAMYRRETALRQIDPETPVFAKASQLLTERVEKLEAVVRREAAQSGMSQMSGYDADIDYLRRMQRDREGEPEVTEGKKPIPFVRDPLREQSIESGYAMRTGLLRRMYADAALPTAPEPAPEPEESEPDPVIEPEPEPVEPEPVDPEPTAPESPDTDTADGTVPEPAAETDPAWEPADDTEPTPEPEPVDEPVDTLFETPATDTDTAMEATPYEAEQTPDADTPEPSPDVNTTPEPEPDAPEDAEAAPVDVQQAAEESTASHRRVSLRELTDRMEAEPAEATLAPADAPEEPPKPKLAYILRRESEAVAAKSFKRMSDLLNKPKP